MNEVIMKKKNKLCFQLKHFYIFLNTFILKYFYIHVDTLGIEAILDIIVRR